MKTSFQTRKHFFDFFQSCGCYPLGGLCVGFLLLFLVLNLRERLLDVLLGNAAFLQLLGELHLLVGVDDLLGAG